MYTRLYIIVFVAFFLAGCSSYKATPDVAQPKVSDFIALLDCFETFYPCDTLTDLTEELFVMVPWHYPGIDSSLIYIVNPLPPFFKVMPSIKVKCAEGWYVFLVHQYVVANIELKYIDVISFDFNGNIICRMYLPFTDAHGGLYHDLDERYSSQGTIAIGNEYMEYKWYHKFTNKELSDTLSFIYKILPDGSMVQVNTEN